MSTAEDFIDDFLAHKDRFYDANKRREYYLRTRQLVGKTKRKIDAATRSKEEDLKLTNEKYDRIGKIQNTRKSGGDNKATQLENQQQRLLLARQRAKKLEPGKREKVEAKINELEKKLKKKLNKINPFKESKTVVRSSRVQKLDPSFKPIVEERYDGKTRVKTVTTKIKR